MADIFDFYVYDDRSIQFALAEPIMLEDKDVTQFRFRIPKVLNNIDMTSWEWWFIFVNAKKVKYTTQLTLEDDEDDPNNYSVATYTVGYGFSGYVGSVSFSIEALNVSGEDIVNEWHTRTYNTTVTDTLQGSRAVIPEPGGQSGTGLTEEIRQALLQIARKVAYIDEHGQTYYNNLYDALYAIQAVTVSPTRVGLTTIGATSQLIGATVPSGGTITWTSSDTSVATVSSTGLVTSVGYGTATITASSGGKVATCSVLVAQAMVESITAVYTQSGTVTDMDSLDSLKPDLVVTAYYDNNTSAVVTDYTLSGTLTVGTSTITVTYAGLTTTFTVTVTSAPVSYLYNWDFTQSLVDSVEGQEVTLGAGSGVSNATRDSSGLSFNAATQYAYLGAISPVGKTFEIDVSSFDFKGSTSHHIRFLSNSQYASSTSKGLGAIVWRKDTNQGWTSYGWDSETSQNAAWSASLWNSNLAGNSSAVLNAFSGKTVKVVYHSDGHTKDMYLDNDFIGTISDVWFNESGSIHHSDKIFIGGQMSVNQGSGDQCYDMTITGIRIYANNA